MMEVIMKKLLLILLVVFAGLLVFSCKSSTSPDLDIEGEFAKKVVAVFSSYNDGEETYASINIRDNLDAVVTLRVNGEESELYHTYVMAQSKYHFFDVPFVEFGSTFSYEIGVDDKTYSGSIKHPDKYEVDFPQFDQGRDYVLEWSMASNPENQHLDYYISSWDDDTEVDETVTLKPSTRKHTIKKDKWSHFDEIDYFDIYLNAINKKNHGADTVVFAYSEAYNDEEYWEEWEAGSNKLPKGVKQIMDRYVR